MRRVFTFGRFVIPVVGVCGLFSSLSFFSTIASPDLEEELPMLLPVMIGDKIQMECEALIAPQSGAIRLRWSDLEATFGGLLRDELVRSLADEAIETGYLSLIDLRSVGLEGSFDLQSLEVAVDIPPSLLRTRVIRMSEQTTLDSSTPHVGPSGLSGFLNVRMLTESRFGGGVHEGLESPSFNLEQVVNVRDWVLELAGTFEASRVGSIGRQYTRLIRDVPTKRVRYSFGDIRPVSVSFQDSAPLIGFSVERENRLQPFYQHRPRAQSDLFVEHDSDVEIFVNGDRVRRLQLTPGPYRIEDLQLPAGSTDVEMVMIDKFGVEKRIDLNFSFDQALLSADETDYYLGAGFRPGSGSLNDGYDWNQPVVSGFYRQGRTDVFTSDWNFQASRDGVQLGSNSIWASKIGTFRGELSSSSSLAGRQGYAVGMSYIRYAGQGAKRLRRGQWRADVYHYSPAFQGIESTGGFNPVLDCRIAHSKQLPWGVGLSFGVGFQRSQGGRPDSLSARASFSKRFTHRLSSRLNLNAQKGGGRESVLGASLRLEWSFGADRGHRLGTGVNTQTKTRELQYSYQPTSRLRAWNGTADLKQSGSGGWYGDLRAGYVSPRAELDLSQSFVDRSGQLASVSRLQVASSLAFAGGHWGFSRPINDSFALVTGHDSLEGIPVGLNDQGQGEEASLNRWGPAVISDVQSYYPKPVWIEAPDELSFGHDLGPTRYVVASTYRSGSHISIGGEPKVFVRGRIRDENESPFGLQAGEVFFKGEPNGESETVFTTREGAFIIEGLVPGDYEIRWFDEGVRPLSFNVPVEAEESVDLGTLEARMSEEK